ncbi:NAD(P)-binding domain-containing protein, partial [Bacillus pumilus]|uniref:NAD(P)-binding domain-containing protein n=1 Tax=Bacillus pumilus TaxID=1408 RepID=UPI0034D98663
MTRKNGHFTVNTSKHHYLSQNLLIPTPYYHHPNYINLKPQHLPHLYHYFKQPHPYFHKHLTLIAPKNSTLHPPLQLVKS